MPRRSTSRPAATRTPGHLKARPTRLSDVPIARRYIAYKYRWRLIDIRKLIGSRRCSGLTVEHQQQTQWCWAAVSNSVSHFYDAGSTWTQCAIVNAELGQTTCCTNGSSAACNQSWYLDRALTRVGCLLSWASGTLTFATVKSLINSTRPPCARQGWSGGGGHFMAIVCYFEGLLGLARRSRQHGEAIAHFRPVVRRLCRRLRCLRLRLPGNGQLDAFLPYATVGG